MSLAQVLEPFSQLVTPFDIPGEPMPLVLLSRNLKEVRSQFMVVTATKIDPSHRAERLFESHP